MTTTAMPTAPEPRARVYFDDGYIRRAEERHVRLAQMRATLAAIHADRALVRV